MKRLEAWVVRHAAALVPIFSVLVALLTAATIWLALSEIDTRKRLGPVTAVSPCRTFGPDHRECRRQSRKIIRSCLTHRDCLALIDRLITRARRQGIAPDNPRREGGSNQQPSQPSSPQPSSPPPQGGGGTGNPPSGGNGGGGPPGGSPDPPQPTPPPKPPNVVEQVTEDVTDTACDVAPVPLPIC